MSEELVAVWNALAGVHPEPSQLLRGIRDMAITWGRVTDDEAAARDWINGLLPEGTEPP